MSHQNSIIILVEKVILLSSRGVVRPNAEDILMAQEIIIFLLGGGAEFSAPEGDLKK